MSSQKSASEEASSGIKAARFICLIPKYLIAWTLRDTDVTAEHWKRFCSTERLAHNRATSSEALMVRRPALLLAAIFSLLPSVAAAASLDSLSAMKVESLSAVLETGSLTLFGGGLLVIASLLRARLRRRGR
jgi:hypothetical protein